MGEARKKGLVSRLFWHFYRLMSGLQPYKVNLIDISQAWQFMSKNDADKLWKQLIFISLMTTTWELTLRGQHISERETLKDRALYLVVLSNGFSVPMLIKKLILNYAQLCGSLSHVIHLSYMGYSIFLSPKIFYYTGCPKKSTLKYS